MKWKKLGNIFNLEKKIVKCGVIPPIQQYCF